MSPEGDFHRFKYETQLCDALDLISCCEKLILFYISKSTFWILLLLHPRYLILLTFALN